MIKFRIETAIDPDTNLVSASIHYPASEKEPIARTACIFPTPDLAKQEVLAMLDEMFTDEHQPPIEVIDA